MKNLTYALMVLALVSCASQKTMESGEAKQALENKFAPRVGAASKQDFVQEFGPASWCRSQPTGDETCRFYKKMETKWMGDPKNRVARETYDEVIAEFDENGVLKTIKTGAQR